MKKSPKKSMESETARKASISAETAFIQNL